MLLTCFIVLSLAFSLNSPIFEAPDEIEHFRYIRTLAQTGALPAPDGQPRGQYHQPPLYYGLLAPLLWLLDDSGFEQIDGRKNPFYAYEFAVPGSDNKNEYLHTRAEIFPYTDSPIARTMHLLRLVSILMGATTLFIGYRIFCLIFAEAHLVFLALGFACFLPQFAYISGHLNNDNLLMLWTSVVLWWLLRFHGQAINGRQAAWLGILLGLAALTKSSAAFLGLPVLVALALNRAWWRFVPIIGVAAFIICSPYYVRNLIVYGDLTLLGAWQRTWAFDAVNQGRFVLEVAQQNFPYVFATFPARFGSGAITLGDFFRVFELLALLVAFGFVVLFLKNGQLTIKNHFPSLSRQWGMRIIIIVFAFCWLIAAFYLAGIAWSGNQGRYLLPGLPAWGILAAMGLSAFIPRRGKWHITIGMISAWGLLSVYIFAAYFLPAYRLQAAPDNIEVPLQIRYGDVVELIGVSTQQMQTAPDNILKFSLYWRALKTPDLNLQVYLHSLETDLIRRDSVPGTGKLLSTDWQAGDTWTETYTLVIPPEAEAQRVYRLIAGLYDAQTQTRLPAYAANGSEITPIVGRIAVNGTAQNMPEIIYRFDDGIGLTQPDISLTDEELRVCMVWVALAPVPDDYNLFVHVLDAQNTIIAQYDNQPRGGTYPTGAWLPGETIDECITLAADIAQIEQVALGLYRLPDFVRLPVVDNTGNVLPDDKILLRP